MRITQGQFSFLPDLTDTEIRAQADYAIARGWALSVEHTDDPHPRNTYWRMWGLPLFGAGDGAALLREVLACRRAWPSHWIKVNAFDATRGIESMAMSFIVQRPEWEPELGLERQDGQGRVQRYALRRGHGPLPQNQDRGHGPLLQEEGRGHG